MRALPHPDRFLFYDFQCTTSYFEGAIAILEPNGSWVAKWQRIGDSCIWAVPQQYSGHSDIRCFSQQLGQFEPGMYAIEVLGELPEDAIEHCENFELEYRAKAKQNKWFYSCDGFVMAFAGNQLHRESAFLRIRHLIIIDSGTGTWWMKFCVANSIHMVSLLKIRQLCKACVCFLSKIFQKLRVFSC